MKKTKHILFLTLATFALAACTQDELNSPSDTMDEVYPLTITGSIAGGGGADTRVTISGNNWEIGDTVALWVQSAGVYPYKVTDVRYETMTGGFYWTNKDESKIIQAIYPYSAAKGLSDFDSGIVWSVSSNQSEASTYKKNDFLCSNSSMNVQYGSTPPLTFYHQTSKIVVNVKNEGYLSGEMGFDDVRMIIGENNNINLGGTFTPMTVGLEGSWSNLSTPGTIIPYSITPTSNYAATFQAFVIPQDIAAGNTLFQFYVGDVGPFRYTVSAGSSIKWDIRTMYTYNVTLNNTASTRSAGTAGCEVELVEVRNWNE